MAEARRKPPLPDEQMIKDLGDSLLRLREYNLRRQMEQIEFLIGKTRPKRHFLNTVSLTSLMVAYTAQKRQIQKLLDTRSMAGCSRQPQAQILTVRPGAKRITPMTAERRRPTNRSGDNRNAAPGGRPYARPAPDPRDDEQELRTTARVDAASRRVEPGPEPTRRPHEDLVEVRLALGPDGLPQAAVSPGGRRCAADRARRKAGAGGRVGGPPAAGTGHRRLG